MLMLSHIGKGYKKAYKHTCNHTILLMFQVVMLLGSLQLSESERDIQPSMVYN